MPLCQQSPPRERVPSQPVNPLVREKTQKKDDTPPAKPPPAAATKSHSLPHVFGPPPGVTPPIRQARVDQVLARVPERRINFCQTRQPPLDLLSTRALSLLSVRHVWPPWTSRRSRLPSCRLILLSTFFFLSTGGALEASPSPSVFLRVSVLVTNPPLLPPRDLTNCLVAPHLLLDPLVDLVVLSVFLGGSCKRQR